MRNSSEHFCEVNDEDVKILVLLFALLLNLSGTEYLINCTSLSAETTLAFRHYLVKKMGIEPVQNDLAKDFARSTQKGHSPIVVTGGFVTLP
jgi:hypothetical protein